MSLLRSILIGAAITTIAFVSPLATTAAHAKDNFKVCWSIYVGWMPWDFGAQQGIVKKWADKYDLTIDVVQINDYVESINQYTAGGYDGCTMTNMDALTIPAAGGVDSTALIVGDFSNGNDGIVLKQATDLKAIKGQKVNLVELSVSHYLLARGLESIGLAEKDITVVNTSDADMVAAYTSDDVTAVTTWNPLLSEIVAMPDSTKVFDSSKIPGEIIDLMVVNTETLTANPNFGKALVGAWYEIMDLMSADSKQGIGALTAMAKASGTDLAGYKAQLDSTEMFYQPAQAVAFVNDQKLKSTMQEVARFSFEHGLLGDGAADAGFIGIETPAGVLGSKDNIKLRFTSQYMNLAAEGKL
ncbi:MAG: putative urea ABC transporter substrate-binding protein [Burkholderiaceae bacterium]